MHAASWPPDLAVSFSSSNSSRRRAVYGEHPLLACYIAASSGLGSPVWSLAMASTYKKYFSSQSAERR